MLLRPAWSKKEFEKIKDKVRKSREELVKIQDPLQEDPLNSDLVGKEKRKPIMLIWPNVNKSKPDRVREPYGSRLVMLTPNRFMRLWLVRRPIMV